MLAPETGESTRERSRQALTLAVCISAGYMFPVYLTGAMGVAIAADTGVDGAGLGAAVATFFAAGSVLLPFGGRVVDRMGTRFAARCAVFGAVACLLAVAIFGGTLPGLCAALAVGGVGSMVAAPVGGALIARTVPQRRQPLAFALERSSVPAATLVAGLAVPTLGLLLHWRLVFALGAVLVLAILALPVPAADARQEVRPRRTALRPLAPLLLMTAVFVLCAAAAFALSTFLVDFGVRVGMPAGLAGAALAASSAATIAVRMVLGLLGVRLPVRTTVAALLLCGTAGFALLAVPSPAVAWPAALLAGGAAWGWTGVASLALVTAHPAAPGAATALAHAGGCLGGILGPLLMGVLVEHVSHSVGWLVMAGLVLLAAVFVLVNKGIWAVTADRSDGVRRTTVDRRTSTDITSERTAVRYSGTAQLGKGVAVRDGSLTGLRVLDVSTILAGPLCCRILGDHGADVIKIEHPVAGDAMRGHGATKDGISLWWKEISRNKRTVGINLSTSEGADLLLRLAATADVLVENFRPGTLERWGIGPDRLHQVNRGLVIVRVTGFGQTGPYASRAGFGTLAEAMSGFAHLTGEAGGPPTLPAFGLADSICAMAASTATMMALWARDRNGGQGEIVDINLLEPIMTAVGNGPMEYDQLGIVGQRHGNRSTNNAPRNTYRTKDGRWVAISTSAQRIAERLLELVGHPEVIDEPWFASGALRAQHADELDEYVGGWIAAHTEAEVRDTFAEAGVAVAPIYSARDLVEDEHVRATEMLVRVPDDDFGSVLMQNVLWRMSNAPGRIRFAGRPLGADTDEVLGEIGVQPEDLARLRAERVVA